MKLLPSVHQVAMTAVVVAILFFIVRLIPSETVKGLFRV